MKKFEYKTLYYKLPLMKGFENKDEELNKLGREGWECVNASPITAAGSTNAMVYVLKRELTQ